MTTTIIVALILAILSLIVWKLHTVTIKDAYARLFSDIDEEVKKQVDEKVQIELSSVKSEIASLEEMAKANAARLEVTAGNHTGVVEGIRHRQLERLITLAANRMPTMMVGMAGTGKTHAASQVAQALGLEFYAMSVGAQTSKSDIMGYMSASGDYVETLFRRAVEHGGVIVIDEIDAGNANVLIQMNAVLSNEYCAFPDQMVKKHDDFVLVAAANTYGTGANRQYVGRNQLDAATLDRFSILEWEIDPALEKALSGTQHAWYDAMVKLRQHVSDEGMRVLVTPRATQRGAKMLAASVPLDDVMDMAIVGMFPNDKKDKIRGIIREHYNRANKTVTPGSTLSAEAKRMGEVLTAHRSRVDDREHFRAYGDWIIDARTGKKLYRRP